MPTVVFSHGSHCDRFESSRRAPCSIGFISTLADAIHPVEAMLVGALASARWPVAVSGPPLKPLAEDIGSLTCAPAER